MALVRNGSHPNYNNLVTFAQCKHPIVQCEVPAQFRCMVPIIDPVFDMTTKHCAVFSSWSELRARTLEGREQLVASVFFLKTIFDSQNYKSLPITHEMAFEKTLALKLSQRRTHGTTFGSRLRHSTCF
jgi:hypothetical protein